MVRVRIIIIIIMELGDGHWSVANCTSVAHAAMIKTQWGAEEEEEEGKK